MRKRQRERESGKRQSPLTQDSVSRSRWHPRQLGEKGPLWIHILHRFPSKFWLKLSQDPLLPLCGQNNSQKILTDNLNQMTQILRKHRAITIVSQACYSYASLHHYFPLPKTSHPQHAMYPCLRVVGPTNWRNPMKSVSCLTQSWVRSI